MKKHFAKLALGLIASTLMGTAHAADSGGCTLTGPEDAPITIQEFVDFQCGFCAQGTDTMKELLASYPGKIKLVYRNMPLAFHTQSEVAAKAMTGVWLQDAELAYAYENKVFDNQDRLNKDGEAYLMEVASDLGLNTTQLKTDMDGPTVAKMIEQDKALAEAHHFQGTPSFIVGSEEVRGARPLKDFKKIVDAQLAKH